MNHVLGGLLQLRDGQQCFVKCMNCRRAEDAGGKNVRTRSSILINTDLKTGFPWRS